MIRKQYTPLAIIALALFLAAAGCSESGEDSIPLDDEGSSFNIGKADGPAGGYSACELREVLKVVNESASTPEFLNETVRVHKRAADNIVAHRLGPDGVAGTRDDDLFDDLAEVDAIPYVGPVALERLIGFISDRCVDDLNRPFISAATWTGYTGGGWTRDSVELEATVTLEGIKGTELRAILAGDHDGRTGFQHVRKANIVEAFTFNFPLDEIPWNSKSHDAREDMPYASFSIESGRFDVDPDDGERELSLGTDKMDDTYYDDKDYNLLAEGIVLRARVRWDTDETVRRLLIAAKFDSEVGDDGLKRAGKIDTRTEGGRHTATLDDDIRSGKVTWQGSATPLEPVKAVWDALVEANRLQDMGGNEKVLLLDPKAHIRSVRSRFHFNFTTTSSLQSVHTNGRTRIQEVIDFAQAQLDAGAIDPSVVDTVQGLIAQGQGILDGTLVIDAATPGLTALDPANTDTVLPAEFLSNVPGDLLTLDKREVMANAAREVYASFSDTLDEVDRDLTNTRSLPDDEYVDMFIEWRKSVDTSLRVKTIAKPFLDDYLEIVGQGDTAIAEAVAAFDTYASEQLAADNKDFEDYESVTREVWDNVGPHLRFENLKYSQRMIEAAGTASLALWFDLAREFYIPDSRRTSSNFIIDTMDFTEMLTPEEWNSIPEADRTPAAILDGAKVFHSTLVNEVQIELTEVEEYMSRIDALQALIDSGNGDENTERMLAGSKMVFDTYQQAIIAFGEMKGDDVLDELDDLDAPSDLEWVPAKYSKGKTALLILTDNL